MPVEKTLRFYGAMATLRLSKVKACRWSVKVGDLVRLKDEYERAVYVARFQLPLTGLVVWKHPRNDVYIRLLNMRVEVLTKYYEVISESR